MNSWRNDYNAARGNYAGSGLSQTRDVGYYAANSWGFFDMHGNVWEWCWDTFERPLLRRVRGGGFTSISEVALRENGVDFPANLGAEHIGFRLVRTGRPSLVKSEKE